MGRVKSSHGGHMKYATCIAMLWILPHPCGFAINLFDEVIYRPYIADKKAFLVGDVITVMVLENSDAKTSADLSSEKDIKSALEVGYRQRTEEASLGLRGKGHAQAKTERVGRIKASLSVQIKEVLPNGRFRIEGNQRIQINGECQTIILCGMVREEDISPQNTILSSRIGDAQITYTGDGSVSDSQRRNYIYKALSFLGLI
jgi:flagellar L-ring protein precursor FlgH